MKREPMHELSNTRRGPERSAALVIGVTSILLIAFMAAHPVGHSHDTAGLVAQAGEIATRNGIVHGVLLVLMAAVFTGLLGLCERLDWRLQRVKAGAVFYAFGLVCMLAAALVNGFIYTGLGASYTGRAPAELDALKPVFELCFHANQTAARAGTVALSLAIGAWSLALLRQRGRARGIAGFGLCVSVLPILGVITGHLRLNMHGMFAIVLAHSIWNLSVALWLFKSGARADGDRA